LLVSIRGSTQHRYLANDDTLARSAIDQIKQQIELPATLHTSKFQDCPTFGASNPYSSLTLPSSPGYTVTITGVQCFKYSSPTNAYSLDSTCVWYATSPQESGCASDSSAGLEQISIAVHDPSGYTVSMSTIVRDPSYGTSYG